MMLACDGCMEFYDVLDNIVYQNICPACGYELKVVEE
jgi:rRNA maturation endonuclease Nob1